VTETKPRPPLFGRIPPSAWPVLTWCAAFLFALALWLLQLTGGPPNAPFLPGAWGGTALALALALQIGLARRRPLPILGVLLAESPAAAALSPWAWVLLLPVMDVLLLYVAADVPLPPDRRGHSRRTTALAAVAVLAVQIGGWRIQNGGWEHGLSEVAAPIASAALVAWLLGDSIRQRRAYAELLREQAADQAVQAERLRIARELHDMVAHSIGVVAIQAGAAKRVIETQPAGARKALDAIELTSRETLAGLRRMLGALHRTGPEPGAVLADVDRLAEGTTGAGVRVEVRWRGERRPLPPDIDRSAFRIIQESLTNVVRHAEARHCRVDVDYRAAELAIEVVDDGRGAAPDAATRGTGYGISGMRDRVDLLRGEFSAGPRPGGGFRVTARLPG
jgi:signal transduction histidine kinase